jgi:flagellar hook-associated protein 2
MPTISSAGAGSGLDVNALLTQLMAAERQPLVALQRKEAGVQAQISAYGTLRSALSSFQSATKALSDLDKFKIFKATSSDEDVLTATADAEAAIGTYTINNVTALAQHHKLASGSYAAATTTVGTGTLTITSNSESFNVTVDGTNNTLEGIRDAINNAADNVGVTATIISVTGGSRLVLTADESGASYQMTVAVSGDGDGNDSDAAGLSNLIWSSGGTQRLSQVDAAQDAAFQVDGFAATSASNNVTTVIDGVTLTLKTTTATAQTVKLDRDVDAVTESINEFVEAYNSLVGTIKSLRTGDLAGDSTLITIEAGLRNVLNTPSGSLTGTFRYLSEIGVQLQKDGTMALDASRLDDAVETDFVAVADVFAKADAGYAYRLEDLAYDYLLADGIVDAREEGLGDRLELFQSRIEATERRLTIVEQRYRTQFAALDSLLGSMRSTSDFLTRGLASLG